MRYIGETCGQSLRCRWRQLERAILFGKTGHSGGLTLRKEFAGKMDHVYVAALGVESLKGSLRDAFIRYVERKLLWDFARRHGTMPSGNRK